MRITLAPRRYSETKLARTFTWARLWLARALATLAPGAGKRLPLWLEAPLHVHIAYMRRGVLALLVLRAFERVPPPRWRRSQRPAAKPARASGLRRVFGAHMRRALRGHDLRARILALVRVMQDPEPAIAELARRWARGFTRRLRSRATRPRARAPAQSAPAATPAGADTS